MATIQRKMDSKQYTERRENHEECGDNRARKYSRRTAKGILWFCHNCGERGFSPTDKTSPKETVRNVTQSFQFGDVSAEQFVKEIRLPSDYNQSIIPIEGRLWLDKYFITNEEISQYGIGYSERYKRLILPIFEGEKLVYWQGRNLKPPYTKENPKYLNIRQSGAKNIFFGINPKLCLQPNHLVVVEDILSAIRVGRTHNCLSLLGSYFPPTLIEEFKPYDIIMIYLDNDKWKDAVKAASHFHTITGKQFIIKQHLKDPKELLPDELSIFLSQ
jgi:ribosomal protein L37AE/L43A